jgi:hypothetical protein
MARSILIAVLVFTFTICTGQVRNTLPSVFQIGEHQQAYDKLSASCDDLLSNVCKNSMEQAYFVWTDMLIQLENFSKTKNYDIKGIKVWINVFWNADGSIKHIVYHPKPNSRNTNYDELTTVLNDFLNHYEVKLTHTKTFFHYGSASFPVQGSRVGKS